METLDLIIDFHKNNPRQGPSSQQSTIKALQFLPQLTPQAQLLDVGCGTGILAFAAQLLGARAVVAFDVDPAAALLCDQYRRMNGLRRVPVFCGSLGAVSIEGRSPRFEVALVNVVPTEIGPEMDLLVRALVPGGRALFSGILAEEGAAARAQLARHGFRVTAERTAGEWVAFVAELGR